MASSEAAMMMSSNPLTVPKQQLSTQAAAPPAKKKRSLPGTPDPDAEVIALSPRTLLATNRFVCEICGKGFQRDQNLQLHRRGHNLPWKLRQRSGKEAARKRVYVCPEKSCVHHNPARALGDLTGIKKHFCRKHGEKKWKCDKCNKKYAVQSDWKAHAKTCGTREYRCDCGTLFSRRDSFITHRAFCDALAEETARSLSNHHQPSSSTYLVQHLANNPPPAAASSSSSNMTMTMLLPTMPLWQSSSSLVAPDTTTTNYQPLGMGWLYGPKLSKEVPSLFSDQHQHAKQPPAAADMSATALLQKAAQIGAVTAMPLPQAVGACCSFEYEAPPVGASQQQNASSSSLVSMPNFDTVLSAAVRQAVVGREETRDFLGVGVQAQLCSSSLPSLHGWI